MKMKSMIKVISLTLCFVLCFSTIPAYAADASSKIVEHYSADIAYGKIFVDGVNQTIKNKNQLDTQITNIGLFSQGDTYILKFTYGSNTITIPYEMVEAKANNVNNDHYLFSPVSFVSDVFNCVSIKFTTCANDYDLMPVNSDFSGATVLSIIFEEKTTSDIYYWQVLLESATKSPPVFTTSTDETVVEKANEFYYINDEGSVASGSVDEFVGDNMASIEEYEEYKSRDYTVMTRDTHNPYYDIGIPDSTFKTATDSWRWLAAGLDSNGHQLPIRYYAYSYTQYGNPNIMTHIMIVGYVWQGDTSYSTYQGEDGAEYAKASAMMKVELFMLPHTVVYYTESNTFGLMLGGERLTQIEEPAIEIKKASSNIPHVVVGRYEFSDANKKGNFLGLGALVLSEVVIGVLDLPSFGFASVLVDIGELIDDASTTVNASDGLMPIEEYYCNYNTQVQRYGYAMGSVRSRVRGYLREQGQHLGVRVWFATPYANRANVTSYQGIYYVSASMR